MDDQPGGSGDAQPDGIRDGMANVECLDLEWANPEGLTGLDGMQVGFARQAVAGQLDLDQAAREGRGVDREP